MRPSNFKWCVQCQTHHSVKATKLVHRRIQNPEPKDFEEYALSRLDNLSAEVHQDFDIHPEHFQMLRAFWHTTWLDAKGAHDEANAERLALDGVLHGTDSVAVPELVMA